MPMIQLTAPSGALPDDVRRPLQQALAKTLLKWEGAPDNAFFRAQAWSYLIELPDGTQATAEDALPRFRVDVTVPEGALSDRRREGLIKEVTSLVLDAARSDRSRRAAGVGAGRTSSPKATGARAARWCASASWPRWPLRSALTPELSLRLVPSAVFAKQARAHLYAFNMRLCRRSKPTLQWDI